MNLMPVYIEAHLEHAAETFMLVPFPACQKYVSMQCPSEISS